MNTFTKFLTGLVAQAQVELDAEERAGKALETAHVHKDVDYLGQMYNRMEKLNKTIDSTTINVMSGYDSSIMDSNDFRFAHKTYHKSERNLDNASYFDYLLATQGVENKVRERKVIRESYDFDLTDTVDRLPWKKVSKKDTPSRTIVKEHKSLPRTSYLPSKPSASTTKYNATQILKQDGKTPISTTDFNFYKVVNYSIYKMYVVLDITPVDSLSSKRWFDDEILGLQQESIDHSRDEENLNEMVTHLVFRYNPLTKQGKPNPYCGLTQLKAWLKSQDFINNLAPATLKDALEILKGSVVSIPNAMKFNYSTKSDNLTVYTVFGDFENFTESFNPTKQEYQIISEFTERDLDSESSEQVTQEVYAKISTKITPILSYDCHKEFSTQLGLEYSHISAIFD